MTAGRTLTVRIIGDDSSLQAATTRSEARVSRFGKIAKKAMKIGALGVAAGTAYSVKAFADFDDAMTKSLAIMGDVSGKQRKEMVDAARQVGRTSSFSAKDAGEAYFFLASAGLDATASIKAMPKVAKFAQAGNFDLAKATDLVTDAQSALGLTSKDYAKNLRNQVRVQDVLVKANTLANATVEQFSLSLTNKAGAAAKNLGKEIEETSAVLAAFADQGVKGQVAGTALNIVWRDLQTASLKNKEVFKEQNVEVFNQQGEMRRTAQIVGDLEKALQGMSDEEKKATLTKLGFQDKSQSFILTLLGTSAKITEYETKLKKARGVTDEVAKKQLKGLTGAWILLKSQVQDVALTFGSKLAPSLEQIAKILGDPKLDASEKFDRISKIIGDKMSEGLSKAIRLMIDAGPKIIGALASSLGKAWTGMSPLAKLFTVAAITRAIGGKGSVIGAGAAIGRWLGIGISSSAAAAVGGSSAGGAAAGAAGAAGAGGILGKLKGIKWARVGGLGLGLLLANGVINEFGARAEERSGDLTEALKPKTQGFLGLGDNFESMFGFGEGGAAKSLLPTLERLQQGRTSIGAQKLKDLEADARSLNLSEQQEKAMQRTFQLLRASSNLKVNVNLGMDPGQVQKVQNGLHSLKTGYLTTSQDIQKVSKKNERIIASTFGKGSKQGRELTARNLRATAVAYKTNMDRSGKHTKAGMERVRQLIAKANLVDPSRRQAQAFGREWAKGMNTSKEITGQGLKQLISKLKTMPPESRAIAAQTWFAQIKEAKRSGKITGEEFRKLRSKIAAEFQGISLVGKKKGKNIADGVISSNVNMINTTGRGYEVYRQNTNEALGKFGVKPLAFTIKKFKAQAKQQGGEIVPGTGSGDKIGRYLPVGSYVMNREATQHFGFQEGGMVPVMLEPGERWFTPQEVKTYGANNLDAMNSHIKRQKGGPIPRLGMAGQDPLRQGGQGGLDKVREGAISYYKKNQPKGALGSAPGQLGAVEQLAAQMGLQMTSGLRPWDTDSWHSKNRARDFSNGYATPQELRFATAVAKRWGRRLLELIHTPLGYSIKDGQKTAPFAQADHYDHVHVAMQLGGLIQKLKDGGYIDASSTQKGVALETGKHLLNRGLNYKGASGIIGNAWRESKWDPSAEGTGGGGLWGFTTSPISLADLKNMASQKGKSWTDIGFQTGFMWSGPEPASEYKGALNAQPSAAAAAEYFDEKWERSGIKAMSERKDGAREAMALLTSKGGAGGKTETVPGVFKGAKTGSIGFRSVPSNLKGVERDIGFYQGEAQKYRRALRQAKDKPKIQRALQENLTKIENHLRKLYNARKKKRQEEARKRFTTKLAKQLGRVTGFEQKIEARQKDYERADQYAQQVVDLEPQAPQLAANATDSQREAAEKDYVKRFEAYVNGPERQAYEAVLGTEAGWRNTVIDGERLATRMGKSWEGGAKRSMVEIESINRYSEGSKTYSTRVQQDLKKWERARKAKKQSVKPKDRPEWLKREIALRQAIAQTTGNLRGKLPILRHKRQGFRETVGAGREAFYGGVGWLGQAPNYQIPTMQIRRNDGVLQLVPGANRPVKGTMTPMRPPALPNVGSGSFEEHLASVQGIHWPGMHSKIDVLPAKREAGKFGGAIWETQGAIEGLGLKIREAQGSLGGGGGSSGGESEKDQVLREQAEAVALRERKKAMALEISMSSLGSMSDIGPVIPWAGRYAKGGPVMGLFGENGPEVGVVPEGTNIATAAKTESMLRPQVKVIVHESSDGRPAQVDVSINGQQMEAIVDRVSSRLGESSFQKSQTAGSGNVGSGIG